MSQEARSEIIDNNHYLVKCGTEKRRISLIKATENGGHMYGAIYLPKIVRLPSSTIGKRVKIIVEIVED